MKNEKLMVKLIAGLVIAGVTLSAGATAFADTKDDTATNKIQTAQKEKREGFKRGGNKEGFHGEDIKTKLDAFVKDGTITQAQENKIVEFMNKKDEARKAEMEKVKAMTEEERRAYFEANKATLKTDMFKELVAQGIINQTQADKIKTALPQGREYKGGMKVKIDFTTAFDSLVKDGTITQAQEDKIVEFMKKKDEARKAEMEKVKAMTEEERKAYFEAKKTEERPNLFKELVDAGILNQTQADAAKKVLPQHKGPKGNKVVTPKASE